LDTAVSQGNVATRWKYMYIRWGLITQLIANLLLCPIVKEF